MKYIVGNWKMNGATAQAHRFAVDLCDHLRVQPETFTITRTIVLCPPFPYLSLFRQQTLFKVGGQDCASSPYGAYTGDVSAAMLKDVGCDFVVLGHSERREYHQETNEMVKKKAQAALGAGLTVILCVGETSAQREAGQALLSVAQQLEECLPTNATPETFWVAYEPRWAIGTGITPLPAQLQEMYAHIRYTLHAKPFPLLYGGSVTPQNAHSLGSPPEVDGVLVGGASLKESDFWAIIQAI